MPKSLIPASARTFIFNWLLIVFKIRFDTLVCSLPKLTRQDKSLKSNPFPSLKRKFWIIAVTSVPRLNTLSTFNESADIRTVSGNRSASTGIVIGFIKKRLSSSSTVPTRTSQGILSTVDISASTCSPVDSVISKSQKPRTNVIFSKSTVCFSKPTSIPFKRASPIPAWNSPMGSPCNW